MGSSPPPLRAPGRATGWLKSGKVVPPDMLSRGRRNLWPSCESAGAEILIEV